MTKNFKFSGYEFTSGPEGTIIKRDYLPPREFYIGDQVEYKEISLNDKGIVTRFEGKNFCYVKWEKNIEGKITYIEGKEWIPNLKLVKERKTNK